MANAATEQARREQAYRDFCNLEADGVKPNPNALFKKYIDLNREHPEMRGSIPTTNRSTIYEWCQEDRWKERYMEMKKTQADLRGEKYEAIQKNSYGRLVSFQNAALDTILDLAENSSDPKVRLQAAESILDRTGLGKVPAKPTKIIEEKPEAEEADTLPENATDAEVQEWLLRNSGNSLNA